MAPKLVVCTQRRQPPNPLSCGNSASLDIAAYLAQQLEHAGLAVAVERSGCLGMCQQGPNVRLLPMGKNWHKVGPRELDEIVAFLQTQYAQQHYNL